MDGTDSLARAALDTLSSQVAVLDESGRILFTNSAWGTIGDAGAAPQIDAEGRNYFDAVDPDADEYAADAAAGLRAVLSGERSYFSMEYPCHTPETQHWFLMRVTPFEVGERNFATVAHIDITERRLAELEADANAERADRERRHLEHLVDRINGLLADITRLLIETDTREELERDVCERVVEADPYVAAWIDEADLTGDALATRTSAGCVDPTAVSLDRSVSGDAVDPGARALRDGHPVVVQDVSAESGLDAYGDDGVAAVMAVPLSTGEASYGVLTVCAGTADAFDEREQVVLEALGRAIASAVNAIESKRSLVATRIVEMELTIADDSLLPNAVSAAVGGSVTYAGSVFTDEGHVQTFYTVAGADTEAVLAAAKGHEDVVDATLVTAYDDEAVFRFTERSSLVTILADRGVVTSDIESEDGRARVSVEISSEADARELFEFVADRYERTDLVGYHERERSIETFEQSREELADRLTDRQLTALRTAYYSGFFEWPRSVDGEELAAMMDISRSTFHQHLRIAERKVLDAFFGRE
ncbi:MAG: bacterio-opsin activator domain-containing protein [Haloarculaceae archaeon]